MQDFFMKSRIINMVVAAKRIVWDWCSLDPSSLLIGDWLIDFYSYVSKIEMFSGPLLSLNRWVALAPAREMSKKWQLTQLHCSNYISIRFSAILYRVPATEEALMASTSCFTVHYRFNFKTFYQLHFHIACMWSILFHFITLNLKLLKYWICLIFWKLWNWYDLTWWIDECLKCICFFCFPHIVKIFS